jgi:transposase InsO family protein
MQPPRNEPTAAACERGHRGPLSCPWQLDGTEERKILEARRRTNYGPARLQGICWRHRSTIWKVLRRNGCARLARSEPRASYRRYEWSEPGALLHIDAKRLARFDRPGHWAHGDRSDRSRNVGSVCIVSVVDDQTRLAYSEIHPKEDQFSTTTTPRRAAAWMREQGCGPCEAVMSDNHKAYGSFRFQAALEDLGARHILTPPYTPRWNGKVERFQQTLELEWARSQVWPSSLARDKALRSFLRYYNRRRPHTSLGTGRRSVAFRKSGGRTARPRRFRARKPASLPARNEHRHFRLRTSDPA